MTDIETSGDIFDWVPVRDQLLQEHHTPPLSDKNTYLRATLFERLLVPLEVFLHDTLNTPSKRGMSIIREAITHQLAGIHIIYQLLTGGAIISLQRIASILNEQAIHTLCPKTASGYVNIKIASNDLVEIAQEMKDQFESFDPLAPPTYSLVTRDLHRSLTKAINDNNNVIHANLPFWRWADSQPAEMLHLMSARQIRLQLDRITNHLPTYSRLIRINLYTIIFTHRFPSTAFPPGIQALITRDYQQLSTTNFIPIKFQIRTWKKFIMCEADGTTHNYTNLPDGIEVQIGGFRTTVEQLIAANILNDTAKSLATQIASGYRQLRIAAFNDVTNGDNSAALKLHEWASTFIPPPGYAPQIEKYSYSRKPASPE
jgi:hypothetical protein